MFSKMTSIIKKALCLLVFVSISHKLLHASDTVQHPATYHLSFNSMDFLSDDFSARYKEPTLDQRNLKIVSGKFGKALFNANTFSREDFEKTSMSTWDLDTLLEVLCHHRFEFWKELRAGRMEPFIWGTGRLNGESGTVAFWARGKRSYPGRLFFQSSSSFGRFEKYLIAIEIREDLSLEAYVRDARYDFHRITSAPVWVAFTTPAIAPGLVGTRITYPDSTLTAGRYRYAAGIARMANSPAASITAKAR